MKWLTDFSLLKTNKNFRHVFWARTLSLLTIGMLVVAIPKQVYDLTGDSLAVAFATACEGIAMFIGLLLGGVLADRYERKGLIVWARSLCGLGFVGLGINAMWSDPSLYVIYSLAAWDGFFGAIGVTAMMSIMPSIVGRENIIQARAISMLSVRLATVISPALGGILIASSSVANVYWISAIGTLMTVLLLLALPQMQPKSNAQNEHPLQQLKQGFEFIFRNKIVGSTILIGTCLGFSSAIRILFPEWNAVQFGGSSTSLGLMYAAVPLGATFAALFSAWAKEIQRPGLVMLYACLGVFSCIIFISMTPWLILCLVWLCTFGYLMSVANLLQYSIVQGHTPDEYLGRINSIWLAQDASGDSIAATGLGVLTRFLPISSSLFCFGMLSLSFGLLCLIKLQGMRRAAIQDPSL